MERVLVTAGSGSIGSAVVKRLLEEGIQVVVFDSRPLPDSLSRAIHIPARSTDRDALLAAAEGCSHLFHLEWKGSIHRATAEPVETNLHNTHATLIALETARQHQIPLTFSSTSVYRGDLPRPVTETDPINEGSLYVSQKLYAESCLRAYSHMFDVSTCSLRIFNVYGMQGMPFQIIPRIHEALRTGNPIQLTGDGTPMRDFIHAEDVAEAFIRTLGKQFTGDVFNVGTGVGTSILELTQAVMHLTGKTIPILFAPAKREEARFLIADISKSAETLGFRARISLEDGLKRDLG